jgi:O-antigen ligase
LIVPLLPLQAWTAGSSWRHYLAPGLLFVLVLSIPPKWSTLHIAGVLFLLVLFLLRASDLRMASLRMYTAYLLLWLLPVIGATLAQHLLHLETATRWVEILTLTLRMLGLGIVILLLLNRGWITVNQIVAIALAALFIHGLVGVVQWFSDPNAHFVDWRHTRVTGLTHNPNAFGHFAALAVVFSAALLRRFPRSVALWLILGTSLLGLFGSGSRGALIAMIAGLLVVFPPVNRRSIVAYLAVVVALAISYVPVGLEQLFSTPDIGPSTRERTEALLFGIEAIRMSPLIGWGFESFTQIPGHSGTHSPHNMMIDLAVSSGVIALLGWLISTTHLGVRLALSTDPRGKAILAILVTTVATGALEHSLLVSHHLLAPWMLVTALACHVIATAAPRQPGTSRKASPP